MKLHYIIIFTLILLMLSCTSMQDKSDAYGNFEAIETTISSEVNGKIIQLNISEGDQLLGETIIGYIDSSEFVIKKKQLISQKKTISTKTESIISQINILKQQKINAQFEKDRIENLVKNDAATIKQLDDIKANIFVLEKQIANIETQNSTVLGEIENIEKQIEQVNLSISKCKITCPIKGTVLSKYLEVYEFVTIGKPIFKIGNLENLYLKAYVSGSQLSQIKIGDKVTVLIDKNEKENLNFKGEIDWISTTAEFTPKIIQTKEERVNLVYAIKVKVQNDGSIKIGMPGEVKFK